MVFISADASTHPGGSVIAINGRNAAMAVFSDRAKSTEGPGRLPDRLASRVPSEASPETRVAPDSTRGRTPLPDLRPVDEALALGGDWPSPTVLTALAVLLTCVQRASTPRPARTVQLGRPRHGRSQRGVVGTVRGTRSALPPRPKKKRANAHPVKTSNQRLRRPPPGSPRSPFPRPIGQGPALPASSAGTSPP